MVEKKVLQFAQESYLNQIVGTFFRFSTFEFNYFEGGLPISTDNSKQLKSRKNNLAVYRKATEFFVDFMPTFSC